MAQINRTLTSQAGVLHAGAADGDHWQHLVGTVGAEIATPLTAALERIHELTTSGRISSADLRALRDNVETARRAGMIAQQLIRFASSRLHQSHERVALADTLLGVLTHRRREITARGADVQSELRPADVIVDASLLFSLLNAILDWALVLTRTQIKFTVGTKVWPVHARLICDFATRAPDELFDASVMPQPQDPDSLTWHLLQQTACTMGLPIVRTLHAAEIQLTVEFPRTVQDEIEGVGRIELDEDLGFANSKPLAGLFKST